MSSTVFDPSDANHPGRDPGTEAHIWFTAQKVGTWDIVCGQLCGCEPWDHARPTRCHCPRQFEEWMKAKTPVPARRSRAHRRPGDFSADRRREVTGRSFVIGHLSLVIATGGQCFQPVFASPARFTACRNRRQDPVRAGTGWELDSLEELSSRGFFGYLSLDAAGKR